MSEAAARAAMLGRGLRRCELCQSAEPLEASHRIGRAQGGRWQPPNVLGLCWRCHGWLTEHRDTADHGGWILKNLPAGTDMTTVPVWLNAAGLWPAWFTLDDRGDAHPLDDDSPPPPELPPQVAHLAAPSCCVVTWHPDQGLWTHAHNCPRQPAPTIPPG